ncbi:MAG: uracil-xanthine permease family protein [Coriobacteriales bacterium]
MGNNKKEGKLVRGYGMNELPSAPELGAFGLQHALILMFSTLPAPILISGGLGLDTIETALLISCALFVSGVCTIIQSMGVGPLGARIPMGFVGSFVFISPALLIIPEYGFGGYMGACIVAAIICGVVFGLLGDWLRVIFPPFVSGAVLMVLGTGLIGNAIANAAGGNGIANFGDPVFLGLAAITFIVTLVLAVLGKGFIAGAAPLLGMIVGFVISVCMGMVDFSAVNEAAWIGIPQPLHWGLSFPIQPCLIMTIIAICGVVEILGTTSATVTVAEGRIATTSETRKTVVTQAVTSVFACLFNAVPTISSSGNIGLMGVTRVYSRFAVTAAGVILLVMGLCPKLSTLFSVIPNPVFGGAILMMFGTILVSGMKIIMESELSDRTQTILAVSLAIGIGFNSVSGALAAFPFWVSTLLCGVPGTAVFGVILNILLPGRNLKKPEDEAGSSEHVLENQEPESLPQAEKQAEEKSLE